MTAHKNKTDQDFLPNLTPFKMEAIDDQTQRGWDVSVNNQKIETVHSTSLENSKLGVRLEYGQRPEGYDGFIIREPGGAATIPYTIDEDGSIYVGVVTEYRPTMGEETTNNIPRGFSDFKADRQLESARETAEREVAEETGLRKIGDKLVQLAAGLNPNSTFFDYSQDPEAGVSLFALPVSTNELEVTYDDSGNIFYTFPEHVKNQGEGDKAGERILGSKFIPLAEALRSRDMFTSAAAGQLMAYLLEQGEYLVPQNKNRVASSDANTH